MTTQSPKPLPTTSYAVLGLLSFGQALSGYEIRKWAQNMRFFYWAPAQSQVYSELRRLEKRGFVRAEEVAQEGKPDKRVFTITAEGSAEFERWQREEPVGPTVIKHAMALRLFFGHASSPEGLIEQLETFIAETKEMLGQLAVVEGFFEGDPTFAYPELVMEWGTHYYEAEIEMARSLIARLQQEREGAASEE